MQAGYQVNSVTLGIYIKRIWNDKVKKDGCRNNNGSGYRDLVERPPCNEQLLVIDEPAVESVNRFLLAKHQGWFIASNSFEEQRLVLMKNWNQTENERIGGQHTILQICVYMLRHPEIRFSANTKEISMKRVMGVDHVKVNLSSIDVAIRYLDVATLCFGQPIPDDANDHYRVPVSNSKVISHEDKKFVVSLSCSMFSLAPPNPITGVCSCQECAYIFRLFKKRMNKRRKSANHQQPPHPKCNQRFMARKGLESKIHERKKQLRKEKVQRVNDEEYVEFVDEDHADMLEVAKTVDTTSLPPEMKLLWNVQMKQLPVKSAKGYRWDPRYFTSGDLPYTLFSCNM